MDDKWTSYKTHRDTDKSLLWSRSFMNLIIELVPDIERDNIHYERFHIIRDGWTQLLLSDEHSHQTEMNIKRLDYIHENNLIGLC
jgi:hypothetical protein